MRVITFQCFPLTAQGVIYCKSGVLYLLKGSVRLNTLDGLLTTVSIVDDQETHYTINGSDILDLFNSSGAEHNLLGMFFK